MNMCQSNKRKLPSESCLKGQIFFIASNFQCLESVNSKIVSLGGKVDPFFSKEITTVLVEDYHCERSQLLLQDINVSRPNFSFNSPRFHYQPVAGSSINFTASTLRGYTLLSSVATHSNYINESVCRVVETAKQWGIQVVGIAMFLEWANTQIGPVAPPKKRKLSEKVTNLTGFFIKFESDCKKFKPCYKMFNNDSKRLMPLYNTNNLINLFKPETCNVILENATIGDRHLQFSHMDTKSPTSRKINEPKFKTPHVKIERKSPAIVKAKAKVQNHYCECCKLNFTDLKQHIKSAKHRSFICDEKNYASVNQILKMLPTAQEFIEKHKKPVEKTDMMRKNGEHSNNACGEPHNSSVHHILPPLLKKKAEEFKQEPEELFEEIENVESVQHIEILSVQPKQEIVDGCSLPTAPTKDSSCIPDVNNGISNDNITADPLFDKTNTSALAQLCLKNFDSYWIDTLPCEMDDIIFDDNFFDFDDPTKQKVPADEPEIVIPEELFQSVPLDLQRPVITSEVTAICLNKQSNNDVTMTDNALIDVKNIVIKSEPGLEPELLDYSCKAKVVEGKTTQKMHNESLRSEKIGDKKRKVSSSTKCKDVKYYAAKNNVDMTPCCSNSLATKSEQMFSSDSSDDENGNVFISNVLNIITNSDSDIRVDQDLAATKTIKENDSGKASDTPAVIPDDMSRQPPIVQKIKRLPPLWSVSIVPGNGVRLKFTCIHSETIEKVGLDTEDSASNEPQSSEESGC